jgi:hypothetical protein
MEKNDNLTRNKPTLSKKLPESFLLAYNQSTKINLIGCDTVVNSPSFIHYYKDAADPSGSHGNSVSIFPSNFLFSKFSSNLLKIVICSMISPL